MRLSSRHSSSLQSVREVPTDPARAVRPMRWMYLVSSFGSSQLMTVRTSLMSSPLAARSVASRYWYLSSLKSLKAWMRCVWLRLPCSSQDFSPSSPRIMAILWHWRLVLKKTITRSLQRFFRTERTVASRCSSVSQRSFTTCWCNFSAVLLSGSALILMGFLVVKLTSFSRSRPMVALNMTVCTSWLQQVIISLISASNPSSSSLSASSNTRTSRFSMPTLRAFISKSMMRPGVPITTSGLFRRAASCFSRELAPMANAASRLVKRLSFWNSSQIWMASSRVGVTTRLRMQPTAATLKQRWIIGRRKAAVLPEPVIELATTSFPEAMTGIASCWMGVGRVYPSSPTAFNSGRISLRSSKDFPLLPSLSVIVAFFARLFLGLSDCSTMTFSSKIASSGMVEWGFARMSILCWREVCLVARKESCWMEERSSFSLRDSLGVCERPSKKPLLPWPMPTSSDSLSIVEDNIIIHHIKEASLSQLHPRSNAQALFQLRLLEMISYNKNKGSRPQASLDIV